MRRVAVIGGGWAGCAAAVALCADKSTAVTLFEAARVLGGRARQVELQGMTLDNGQHILLGAYDRSLQLMRQLGIDPERAMLRLPVQMRYAPHCGGMDFTAWRLPAPFHTLAGLFAARGLDRADKLALARFISAARWMGWRQDQDGSVAELLDRFEQTPRLVQLMWRPLCIAALNTPLERASAQVFLNVLRDSLGARRRSASDMLIPRVDLSTLLPAAAGAYLERHGAAVRTGAAVRGLRQDDGLWLLQANGAEDRYDAVVLATAPHQAAALLDGLIDTAALDAMQYEPITTCYLGYTQDCTLGHPFYALADDAERGDWGQFVFDRGMLDPRQRGVLAVVTSSSGDAVLQGHAALGEAVAGQLARAFGHDRLARPAWTKVITEKRATFACVPDLQRLPNETGLPGLVLAGDHTAGDYPATLEAAVRSGLRAAALLARG